MCVNRIRFDKTATNSSIKVAEILLLWRKLGFETVGCLPKAFNHPVKGYVDALVMYKWL